MKSEIVSKIRENIVQGLRFENPGGGQSLVFSIDDTKITYVRGLSKIHLNLQDVLDVLNHFPKGTLTTNQLKEFRPNIFDSSARPAGHSCNCTFLFAILHLIGCGSKVYGKGVRGNSFRIDLT